MINKIFSPFPVLFTQRLVLRQLVSTDNKAIFKLRTDPIVNKFLGRQLSKSLEDATTFIKIINENIDKNKSIYWAIILKGKLIGTVCLFEFTEDNTKAEIGYELLPLSHGRGFMQEAVSKVLEYGFQHIGLELIEATTHSENLSSTKLLQKLKFTRELIMKDKSDQQILTFRLSKN